MLAKLTQDRAISMEEIGTMLRENWFPRLENCRKLLLIVPDVTRIHSQCGRIAAWLYTALSERMTVDFLVALGSHLPMKAEELDAVFGQAIPAERIRQHAWRADTVPLGVVPADFVRDVSGGLLEEEIPVEVSRYVCSGEYDRILSLGQVVPHEVVGLANYSKNILVGCGGNRMIDATHFLGAVCGMEKAMGRIDTPVRAVFDYAQRKYLDEYPIDFLHTVIGSRAGENAIVGCFVGDERSVFEEAARLSQQENITFVDQPMHKVVAYLDPVEFRTTWVGNKAVYRSRMMMADGGELIVLAPGVVRFGEDDAVDALLARFGYRTTPEVLALMEKEPELRGNRSVAAHMMHGSPEGRFRVSYAFDKLSPERAAQANLHSVPYAETVKRYDPAKLQPGLNRVDGEAVYFIQNPALGLWAVRDSFR